MTISGPRTDGGDPAARRAAECVAIFAKPAVAGRVKTRLIGDLSAAQAAELHAAFLEDLATELRGGRFDLRMAWALGPGDEPPASGVEAMVQDGADLGARLHRALSDLAVEYPRVAVVGSDHPTLTASLVQRAFDKLAAGADVVVGPAGDGGYYLFAARREALSRQMFARIEWSSPSVLEQTLARCAALERRVEGLPIVADVDTPADLDRLVAVLRRLPRNRCRHTRALLRSWGR